MPALIRARRMPQGFLGSLDVGESVEQIAVELWSFLGCEEHLRNAR